MKVRYDKEVDILYTQLSEKRVEESDENKSGVIIDYFGDGEIVGIEILNASKKLPAPMKVEHKIA